MLQQVSAMMGGPGAGQQEDMFAKLDGMRAIITEVNQQFKDPVSLLLLAMGCEINWGRLGVCRKRPPLSACASPSSCRYTRLSVLSKNSRHTELTRTTSS